MPIHRARAARLGLRRRATAAVIAVAAAVLGAAFLAPATAQAQSTTVQHVGVPAYFNPDASPGSTYWTQLDQSAPNGGIAIANPNSGPGSAFDQGYANAIQAATSAGIKVIGYVDTGYFGTTGRTTRGGATTTAAWTTQVEGDIANWYSWYGSYGLGGIFFDDAQNVCGTNNAYVNLYIAVNTYTKQNHAGALTADNPGAVADQCYAQAADILVMFEGTYASYSTWTAPAWELNANNPSEFWNLVYDTPTQANMESAIARSKQNDVGYIYVTSDDLPNPWDTLPTSTYWNDEVSQAGAGSSGGGGGTSPTAPSNLQATNVTSSGLTLSWTASSDSAGISSYTVYAGGSAVATTAGTTTTATLSNLSPSTSYTLTVKATGGEGVVSASSAPLTVTTQAAGGGGGSSCTTSAGSGALTSLTACKYSTYEYFQATFNTSTSLHHVFINTDANTATGYQLPSPSTSKLGADYMLENNTLYRSACSCWGWSAVSGVNPQMTVSGNTYTWTVPLSALSSPAAVEQAEFNANTSYTAVLTFGQS